MCDSCYEVFEVSTPINWLDAQSSCAIWGGNLTNITTEGENTYLNTLITSSVGNCWIGLNDRDEEGMYAWIDGAAVNYTNWASTPSDDTNSNCVQINAGNGIWESVSCEMTLNAFLCKKDPSIYIAIGMFIRKIPSMKNVTFQQFKVMKFKLSILILVHFQLIDLGN